MKSHNRKREENIKNVLNINMKHFLTLFIQIRYTGLLFIENTRKLSGVIKNS